MVHLHLDANKFFLHRGLRPSLFKSPKTFDYGKDEMPL